MIHTFIRGFRISPDAAWIEIICFIGLVILVWTVVLAVFKTQTRRISLCHHFFFSCINTVYSLSYRMHTEKVNGLIYFLVIHDKMIAIAKKTYLKDKVEGIWPRKGKVRSRDVAQKRRK